MKQYKVQSMAWMESYKLYDRTLRVAEEIDYSDRAGLIYGAPQGPRLGPFL